MSKHDINCFKNGCDNLCNIQNSCIQCEYKCFKLYCVKCGLDINSCNSYYKLCENCCTNGIHNTIPIFLLPQWFLKKHLSDKCTGVEVNGHIIYIDNKKMAPFIEKYNI